MIHSAEAFPALRGTSYGSVRNYAGNAVHSPRLDLLRAMASVLNVRADFLAYGSGAMTDTEERERKQAAGLGTVHDREHDLWRHAFETKRAVLVGLGIDWAEIVRTRRDSIEIPYWVAPVAEAARRLGAEPERIGWALRGPLYALGRAAGDMSDAALADYITATMPVLILLASQRKEP